MAYYRVCAECGSCLDPCEPCDCHEKSEQLKKKYEQLTSVTEDGQIIFGGNYEDNKNQDQKFIWA